jgi:hypothetical protein
MWRLLAPQACRIITGTMERLKIYIADGHHRYQAMLAIRDRLRLLNPQAGPDAPWEYIMMFLVNSEHEGLTILPTHRLLHDLDLSRRSLADLNLAIQEHFHVKSYPFNGGNDATVRRRWLRDLRDAEPGVHKYPEPHHRHHRGGTGRPDQCRVHQGHRRGAGGGTKREDAGGPDPELHLSPGHLRHCRKTGEDAPEIHLLLPQAALRPGILPYERRLIAAQV